MASCNYDSVAPKGPSLSSSKMAAKDGSSEDVELGDSVVAVPSNSRKNEPFGDETHAEIKYRTMHWWQAGIIMVAETISIGILSLPSALAAVGLVP